MTCAETNQKLLPLAAHALSARSSRGLCLSSVFFFVRSRLHLCTRFSLATDFFFVTKHKNDSLTIGLQTPNPNLFLYNISPCRWKKHNKMVPRIAVLGLSPAAPTRPGLFQLLLLLLLLLECTNFFAKKLKINKQTNNNGGWALLLLKYDKEF